MPRWLRPALRPVACGLMFTLGWGAQTASGQVRICVANSADAAHAPLRPTTEVICERYATGAMRVERYVAQDSEGNYFNHGPWKMWDAQGRILAAGQYRDDERDGAWVRFYRSGEAEIASGPIGKQFVAPFASEATFVKGQLHGKWTITDAEQRQVISWQYDHGKRNGKNIWWFPNGQKWREANYQNGQIDGKFSEWTPDGRLIASELYHAGRRWGTKIDWYEPGVKRAEAHFLFARELTQLDEDWWLGRSRLELVGKYGEDLRQGSSIVYYRNGQRALQANYRDDLPEGQFVWWHPNGQKAIEGRYADGKQAGQWTWWHANGQRWIAGEYSGGVQIGRWTWWTGEGKVVEAADFVDGDGKPSGIALEMVDAPPELMTPPIPQPASRHSLPSQGIVQPAPEKKTGSTDPSGTAECKMCQEKAAVVKPARRSGNRPAPGSTAQSNGTAAMLLAPTASSFDREERSASAAPQPASRSLRFLQPQ